MARAAVGHDELHKFAVIPKRWVIERSFAWLEKNRSLWKTCEWPAQHQPAVGSLGILDFAVQKTVKTF
jgi:transposase